MSTGDETTADAELLGRVRSVLHSQRVRNWASLVAVQPHGSRLPVFGVHPLDGEVYFYHRLAPLLGSDQPLYGLRARGIDGRSAPLSTVRDMATAYLDEVTQVQPHGPYLLVGRCSGSRVAFEMAQQLTRAGETVAMLCLIDPGPIPVPMSIPQRLHDLFSYFRYHAVRGHLRRAIYRSALPRLRRLRAGFRRAQERFEAGRLRQQTAHRAVRDGLRQALVSARHRESPYSGRVLLFSASDAVRHVDPSRSWSRVAILDVRHVPGDHRTIASPGNLREVARQLRRELDDLAVRGTRLP